MSFSGHGPNTSLKAPCITGHCWCQVCQFPTIRYSIVGMVQLHWGSSSNLKFVTVEKRKHLIILSHDIKLEDNRHETCYLDCVGQHIQMPKMHLL